MRMLLKPMGGVTAMLHGQGTPGRLVQQRCRDHCQGVRRTNCISAVASCSSVTVHATRRRTVWLRCDALGDTRAADSAAASAAAPSLPAAAPPALPGALPAPPPAPPAVNDWYAAVGLSAIAALICSVDRAAISVAILPMSDQFGWDDTTKGAINSAFYVGYTLTNLLGGYLASSLSAKRVLGGGVVVWSLFTMTTPIAAASTLPLLLANRAAMGAGEGVTFPCVQNIVKFWCPPDVRTRALTLIYSGGQLGTIVALVSSPLIIQAFGWPAVFEIYGALGFVWIFAWQRYVSNTPPGVPPTQQQQQQASAAAATEPLVRSLKPVGPALVERRSIPVGQTSLPLPWELPWREFFTNRAFLGIVMAHSAFGVGHYVCLSWLPSYYAQEFGVDVQQSALLSVAPWFVTVLISNSAGWVADWLSNSGRLSMTATRKTLQAAGSVGPALCLLALAAAHEAAAAPGGAPALEMGQAAALMMGVISLGGFQSAGFASNHQDISSRYAAVLFGVTNALSSLAGTCSVYATGVILDSTHSWALVFQLVAGCYLAGAVAFVALASAEPQFE